MARIDSKVTLPGGKAELPILGQVEIQIKIQNRKIKVSSFVIELQNGFQVIIGDPWMRAHHVICDFEANCLSYSAGKARMVLKSKPSVGTQSSDVQGSVGQGLNIVVRAQPREGNASFLLSAMQFKKVIRDEDQVFLAVIRAHSDEG